LFITNCIEKHCTRPLGKECSYLISSEVKNYHTSKERVTEKARK